MHFLNQVRDVHGIEPGRAPGSMTVGGLHVPAQSHVWGWTPRDDGWDDPAGLVAGTMMLNVPDEAGNLYSMGIGDHWMDVEGSVNEHRPEGATGHFTSLDEFAKMYGNMGSPSSEMRRINNFVMSGRSGPLAKMGARPGDMMATPWDTDGQHHARTGQHINGEHLLLDPSSGDLRTGRMRYSQARAEWEQEYMDQEQGRRGGL